MSNGSILSLLESGQRARLIPTVADSKKEQRATSALLATFTVVPGFAKAVLESAGASIGKRAKISCYTEVVFKLKQETQIRPDGLVIITSGKKSWSALVESKIGNNQLDQQQIHDYLDLAKAVGADALITISNQFATLPTHHPLTVHKQKLRKVGLYHFSWLSILSHAKILYESKAVEDPEQAYILRELTRYLRHDSSGVSAFTRMDSTWKDLCAQIQQGVQLSKTADCVERSVSSWQQLLRFLSIQLSDAIGSGVTVYLPRSRAKNPALYLQDDLANLVKANALTADFIVPNAAARLTFNADILRRTINVSMKLDAPKDRKRAKASINWIIKQLAHLEESDLLIRAYWPGHAAPTTASLMTVRDDPSSLMHVGNTNIPTHLEVLKVADLAGRFRAVKSFVEDAERELLTFYESVGQQLRKWIPKPPRVLKQAELDEAGVSDEILEFKISVPEAIGLSANVVEEEVV